MTYQEQQDKLLSLYIEEAKNKLKDVEFIISSACDQKCEYCYLYKHGNEMNYSQANDKKDILNNLEIFLNYLDEIDYEFKNYDIFSGEFFQLPYWENIFEIFYNYHIKKERVGRFITIPTNYSFISDNKLTNKIEYWIKKFKAVDCPMHLSCSIDGPELLDNNTRPNNKILKNKEYYQRIFDFMAKYNFAAHPMISASFLKNYKENYDFFIDNILEHKVKFITSSGEIFYNPPMMLEVRDNEQWSEESLENYKNFLYYVAEQDLKKFFNNDKKLFAYKIFDDNTDLYKELAKPERTQPYILNYPYQIGGSLNCSIQHSFVCRIGDLTLAPCHRLYYSDFELGRFVLDENKTKIIGVEGKNPQLGFKIAYYNPIRSSLRCGACKIKTFCIQNCLGSVYEHTKEIFATQDNVCKMLKTKYQTIHQICEDFNLYDIILNDLSIPQERKEFIKYARQTLQSC